MKNSYLLNSLSKIIENNKPQPVPLFRFLGNILYTRICLIFFFKSEPVWPFFVVWGLMWPWRHRTLELLNKTLRPWSGGGGWCVGWWVVVKAKYIYVNFSMDLVPKMSIDRLIGYLICILVSLFETLRDVHSLKHCTCKSFIYFSLVLMTDFTTLLATQTL